MSDSKPTCFIIMPISTPDIYHERYKEDEKHFMHVLECLFIPAVEEAGFTPILPVAEGAENIPAKIIDTLSTSDLVLCDMSILNANVFFELGVRTALDKPIALTADRETIKAPLGIPLDISNLNFHPYDSSLASYDTKVEIPKLVKHIKKCAETSEGRNTHWKYYGISQTGTLNPEDATISNKLDLLLNDNTELRSELTTVKNKLDDSNKDSTLRINVANPLDKFRKATNKSPYLFTPMGRVKLDADLSDEQLEQIKKWREENEKGIGKIDLSKFIKPSDEIE